MSKSLTEKAIIEAIEELGENRKAVREFLDNIGELSDNEEFIKLADLIEGVENRESKNSEKSA